MKYLFSNLKTCRDLIKQAQASKDYNAEQLLLKIVLIEICGWIEEYLDQLYFDIIKANNVARKRKIKKINKIYGFDYSRFCKAITICLDKNELKKLENHYKQNKCFILFESALNSLRNERNPSAHTHIKGSSKKLIDMDTSIGYLKKVNKGVVLVRKYLKNNNLI